MNIRENLKNNIEALKKLAFNDTVEEVAEPTAEATEETTETEKENFVDAQLAGRRSLQLAVSLPRS